MTINLIASVIPYKNKFAIGKNNELLIKISNDLTYFKKITTDKNNKNSTESKLDKNVIVMGRKTWFSIPQVRRPLVDRINIILTNDKNLKKESCFPKKSFLSKTPVIFDKDVYFMDYNEFSKFYKMTNANVFVIGGGVIYNKFLNDPEMFPRNVYLTEIYNYKLQNLNDNQDEIISMDMLNEKYKLKNFSEKYQDDTNNISYRFLKYEYENNFKTDEHVYLNLCNNILENGLSREDRTGVGTISSFGNQLHFDISENIPLLTTKRVPWKHCIEELLWFLRGDTDAKILQRKNVKIWDGNTSRQFLDDHNLNHYPEGVLGPGYGWQWRFFGANYSQAFSDTSKIDVNKIGGFDQINYVLEELKNNPFSRRIMVSAWNPSQMDQMALPPCHYSFQFYVEEENNERYLSCHFIMRSNDVFLGLPFNILSYAVLTYIIALKVDMKPKKLVYSVSDTHIYKTHIQQIQDQSSRHPRPLPKLELNPDIKNKDFKDITIDDFDIIGYYPHPMIKAPMAV